MVKNPRANAGDAGLIPDLGRFHMQLSLCATITKVLPQGPCATTPEACITQSPCSATREATATSPSTSLGSNPCSQQLGKALHSNKDPVQPKINKIFKIFFSKNYSKILSSRLQNSLDKKSCAPGLRQHRCMFEKRTSRRWNQQNTGTECKKWEGERS